MLLDRATSRPARLPAAFEELYGASGPRAEGVGKARASARARGRDVERPLADPSVADIDTLGHANNAVYWAAIETALASDREGEPAAGRMRGVLEYRRPLDLTSDLQLAIARDHAETAVWFVDGGDTAACAVIRRRLNQ